MVRILANGDIVQDDDPRLSKDQTTQRRQTGRMQASIDEYNDQPQGGMYEDGMQGPTIFDTWNQKLLELGIPRWNIGSHVVEPIMTVMALLVLLFFGLPGLAFLGLLYFVVKASQRSNTPPPRQQRPSRPTTGFGGGGGRRLGR